MNVNPDRHNTLAARLRRIAALISKESRQMLRDPSTILIGMVMPALLISVFGYALSLDVKNVPVAIVLEHRSPEADELAASFTLSPYFKVMRLTDMVQALRFMAERKVDAIVRIRSDFSRQFALGNADVQILVHGADASTEQHAAHRRGQMFDILSPHHAKGSKGAQNGWQH